MYFLLDQYLYPGLSFSFNAIIQLLSPYLPLRNSNIICAILFRFIFILPIASLTRNEHYTLSCVLIVLNELLNKINYVDTQGLKVNERVVNQLIEAYCNQVSNILALLLVVENIDFDNATFISTLLHSVVFYTAILFDVLIVILNTKKYFESRTKLNGNVDEDCIEIEINLMADKGVELTSEEENLKRKFEAFGIALLCLAMGSTSLLVTFVAQLAGFVGIFLSLKLSFELLTANVNITVNMNSDSYSRRESMVSRQDSMVSRQGSMVSRRDSVVSLSVPPRMDRRHSEDMLSIANFNKSRAQRSHSVAFERNTIFENALREQTIPENIRADASLEDIHEKEIITKLPISRKLVDSRVDKIFTIGCFDLFHYGHVQLFENMRSMGKSLIVGVHDSRSIFKLKKRVPVDSTEKRMSNVKKHAEKVFCIAGTDPSNYLTCIIDIQPGETALYVRGDDMINFPGRDVVEKFMSIKFLPYTVGVSSTEIRREKYSHVKPDDLDYLESNNS